MSKTFPIVVALLSSTMLAAPAAFAQSVAATPPISTEGQSQSAVDIPSAQPGDILPPDEEDRAAQETDGEEVVVVGRRDIIRSTPQVISVLSTADLARTGDGNIAGALNRVTGLSVVGSGFVYVRGLGDRYSLALMNGLQLPSPEPLKRVVPLDIFPTNVIDSTLVQKSYSANFPGEFGGGVINLTTKSIPKEDFLNIGVGGSYDTFTTNNLGYVYDGGSYDHFGYDDGTRAIPAPLQAAFDSGRPILEGADFTGEDLRTIAKSLFNAPTTLLQRNAHIPANWSANLTGGKSFALGTAELGLIATGGISNKWRTRDTLQQTSVDADLSGDPQTSYQRVVTDNRVVTNGLIGVGLNVGRHDIRWTNLYIHDTLKQGSLALGTDQNAADRDILKQGTSWYERQLIDTQLVGEFKFGDLGIDLRGGYANSKREAPYERDFTYVRTNNAGDLTGDRFVNDLGGNKGGATIAFSDLDEDLYSAALDLSYALSPTLKASVGYAYNDTERTSTRRAFQYRASALPVPVQQLRPDYLVSDATVDAFGLTLLETSAQDGTAAFEASLQTNAVYGLINAELSDMVKINAGARYEQAEQFVAPIDLFGTGASAIAETNLDNDYILPSATITLDFGNSIQLRASGSKTIARPQFRELVAQVYNDPDSNRLFRGNPSLTDSELLSGDVRLEYYPAGNERFSIAGFMKSIDRPIEAFTNQSDSQVNTSYANAPKAQLFGGELEAQKYFDVPGTGGNRRFVLIGNYTYSNSKLRVDGGDMTTINGVDQNASIYFMDGARLTGQSDHLVNLQFGMEQRGSLSQQTFMLTYASERVTARGPSGQPDVIEKPGLSLDFVARQEIRLNQKPVELKFEARNLTGRTYQEYQQSGDNIIYYNRYEQGRVFSLGATLKF